MRLSAVAARGRRALAAALALAGLSACVAPVDPALTAERVPDEPVLGRLLPAGHTALENDALAALFVELTHETEWGGRRPHLVRYENPIAVGLEGEGADQYRPFLARYFSYLRRNAQVDIRLGDVGRNLHVRMVPDADFRRLLPGAACVVAPGNLAWKDYAARPGQLGGEAMVALREMVQTTVFVPAAAEPYRVRACLLEEIAQALGPLNDLYGLGPSIFNDDFAHVWPTRLDLMMLRVLYDRGMATGMSPAETEAAARAVLDRVNPPGRAARPPDPWRARGAADWRVRIERVISRNTGPVEREEEARAALALAEASFPGTAWHCHSLLILGRVLVLDLPEEALGHLDDALAVCAAVHGSEDVRLARIQVERAAALLALDRPGEALSALSGQGARLAGHGLDERLAAHYALRGRALAALGREAEARAAETQARAWAGYALGRENAGLIDWF